MSAQTGISWTDSTHNPWIGCTKVSAACDHCYAERDMDTRLGKAKWGSGQLRVRTSQANRNLPLRWDRHAEAFVCCTECSFRGVLDEWSKHECPAGLSRGFRPARRRVFSLSLGDWLDNEVPVEWLVEFLDVVRQTPNLDWLLLTKRIGNWRTRIGEALNASNRVPQREWLALWLNGDAPPHVWIGGTMIDRAEMLRDAEKLKLVPAAVKFWSVEPMLGDFGFIPSHLIPDWLICGGESGAHARPMQLDWARALRDQCQAAGVRFHFKQWGEWAPNWLTEKDGSELPGSMWMDRMGRKPAGRLLDGRAWSEFPKDRA